MTGNEFDFEPRFAQEGEWWLQHMNDEPTVILRCGRDGREDLVGEIKTDGTETLVLRYSKFGEATVPVYPAAAFTVDELQRRTAERDSQTLRYTDDGRRVTKRRQSPASVGPLESMSFIICPHHGMMQIPKETIAHLEQFVADTQRGSRRDYLLFRGTTLD